MPYRLFILLALILFGPQVGTCQENNIAIGAWRTHLPYVRMNLLMDTGDKIYAANGSSIFHLDKEDLSVHTMSKLTGLSDVKVSEIGYSAPHNTVIIGYDNGNIDLIQGNNVYNANDLLRSNISGSKRINHIYCTDQYAYISGDYGVLLYDLVRKEVRESYLTLAPNMGSNRVFASTITTNKDSIYLATSRGVMGARLSPGVNLMDYSNWYTFDGTDGIATTDVVSVASLGNIVYAAVDKQGVYYFNGSFWELTSVPVSSSSQLRNMNRSGNRLLISLDNSVIELTNPQQHTSLFTQWNVSPSKAYLDQNNVLWIASTQSGLVRYAYGLSQFIAPDGPYSNKVFRLYYHNNQMIQLSGGYTTHGGRVFQNDWFSTFKDNTEWVYNRYENQIPQSFRDFISASYNPANATLYFSAYGYGLIALHPDQSVHIYDHTNSPLRKEVSNSVVMVGATAVDKNGTLWIPNRDVAVGQPNLHALAADGTWKSYTLPGNRSRNLIDVAIDDLQTKWLIAKGSSETGLVVFNETTNQTRTLLSSRGGGNLPSNEVNCVAKDKNGYVYVGTSQGLAVCYDPASIFKSGTDLVLPIYEGYPLFFQRNVLAIDVDGANRKWVGTSDGLWLLNEDMSRLLAFYNTENSPLISNFIQDIEINALSGEVFVATSEGTMSFRGTATEGDDNFSQVKVFPNPVKPDFNGQVGISGLAPDVFVKITDMGGNLVYETQAHGGTAVWNVRDYNGRRAASGVYLIFCASADGEAKFVSKIAVIE
jgi:ligand-binding sensor domain-containing protein